MTFKNLLLNFMILVKFSQNCPKILSKIYKILNKCLASFLYISHFAKNDMSKRGHSSMS